MRCWKIRNASAGGDVIFSSFLSGRFFLAPASASASRMRHRRLPLPARLAPLFAGLLAATSASTLALASGETDGNPGGPAHGEHDTTGARRVGVLRFFGPGAELARAAVLNALEEEAPIQLVPLRVLEASLNVTGRIEEMALAALVHGRVRRVARGLVVTLTVYAGQDGRPLGQVVVKSPSRNALFGRVRARAWAQLEPLIAKGRPPGPAPGDAAAEEIAKNEKEKEKEREKEKEKQQDADAEKQPEPPPAPEPRPVSVPPAPRPERDADEAAGAAQRADAQAPRRRGCSILDLDAGGGVMIRMFNYRQEERGALRAYTLRPAPVGRVEVALRPFAGRSCGGAGALGLRASFEQTAPVSATVGGRHLGTTAFAYAAELVLRLHFGTLTVEPSAGFFARRYAVEGRVVPDLTYRAVGGGLRIALRLGRVLVEVDGGGRLVLDAGQIQSDAWFPRAEATTYAGRARLGVVLTDWLDVLAGGDAEYSSFDLNASADGLYPNGVAAGAYDLYATATLTLRAHVPGR
jgi:hypothetical protein